jgi:hypothetical protein
MAKTTGRAKLAAAAIGGGALATLGALAFAVGGAQPAVSPTFVSGGMQTGVTVTSTPGVETSTTVAVPAVKATFYGKP